MGPFLSIGTVASVTSGDNGTGHKEDCLSTFTHDPDLSFEGI
jgi:hypothetical protein